MFGFKTPDVEAARKTGNMQTVKIVADFGNIYESEDDLLDFINVYGDRATLHRERINSIINAGAIELCTLIKGKDYNEMLQIRLQHVNQNNQRRREKQAAFSI